MVVVWTCSCQVVGESEFATLGISSPDEFVAGAVEGTAGQQFNLELKKSGSRNSKAQKRDESKFMDPFLSS
jgi:hypothetical protein